MLLGFPEFLLTVFDWLLIVVLDFQLEPTPAAFPLAAGHSGTFFQTSWTSVPLALSWTFQERDLPNLQAAVSADFTNSESWSIRLLYSYIEVGANMDLSR